MSPVTIFISNNISGAAESSPYSPGYAKGKLWYIHAMYRNRRRTGAVIKSDIIQKCSHCNTGSGTRKGIPIFLTH